MEQKVNFFYPIDIFARMRKFNPPLGGFYYIKKIGSFSEIGVQRHGKLLIIFRIYTGTNGLFEYVKNCFFKAAKRCWADARELE